MSRIRAFAAVNFPVPVVRKIADEVGAMKQRIADAGCHVVWVPTANLHLTLKFFGMIEAASVEAIVGRLGRELAGRAPFEIEARGIGAFPSLEQPRVLWAGVTPSPRLAALQKDVDEWMVDLGFQRDDRVFHPHLTLGRVRDPGPPTEWLPKLVAEREALVFGVGRATEVVVYESRTVGIASEYRALGRAALAGR